MQKARGALAPAAPEVPASLGTSFFPKYFKNEEIVCIDALPLTHDPLLMDYTNADVDGNFDCEFYTFIRQLRKMQLYIGPLSGRNLRPCDSCSAVCQN
jgi:hypothetical protein